MITYRNTDSYVTGLEEKIVELQAEKERLTTDLRETTETCLYFEKAASDRRLQLILHGIVPGVTIDAGTPSSTSPDVGAPQAE